MAPLYGAAANVIVLLDKGATIGGSALLASLRACAARPSCLRLLTHCVRAAASRTFCTAGTSSAMRMAMMAITTKSSMSVKPRCRADEGRIDEGRIKTNPQTHEAEIMTMTAGERQTKMRDGFV